MAASPSPPLRARAADRNSRNTQTSVDGLSMVATGPPGEGRTPDAVGAMAISRMSAKLFGVSLAVPCSSTHSAFLQGKQVARAMNT